MSYSIRPTHLLLFLLSLLITTPYNTVVYGATVQATIPVGAIGRGSNAYSPNPITINEGDTVTWTNQDPVPHTVTAQDNSYNSGTLTSGQAFSRTFTTAGTYTYFCSIHGFNSMNGQVVVRAATPATTTAATVAPTAAVATTAAPSTAGTTTAPTQSAQGVTQAPTTSAASEATPPLLVTVFSPQPGDFMGYNGSGWVVDLAVDAISPEYNSLISMSAGYRPFFNNPLNTTTFHAGASLAFPGLVVLLSTTPTVNNSLIQGPTTNLANVFQINTVALTNNGTTKQLWSTWQVGSAAFGVNRASSLTVYMVNGTAPNYVTSPSQNVISNVVQVPFTIAGTQTA